MHRLTLLFLTIFLAGCAASATPAALPVASKIPPPSQTAFTVTPAPSATPTPTHTASPSPTPTLNPMSIEAMRQGSYPGSDIVIEKELNPGSNYRRFYTSYQSEGLKIYALLTIPNGKIPAGGWPAIVFNHGYIPPDIYRTTERYIAYVDRLASAGYIVFRIDYRGNDQSEGIPTGAYGSPGYTVDVLNAVASIKRFPQANPNKIGMWGHSMGGFLTLRAMVISPDIKAGVIWSGVVADYNDLLYNWHHRAPVPTQPASTLRWRSWTDLYGTPQENPQFWDSLSANSYLTDLSGPLQLHHGLADEEVPLEFSQKLNQEVQAAGKTVEFYTYPGNDHNLSQSFTLAMNRTIQFYDQYLK
jgi:uncharacterized protein